jgi:type II secretory pathway pseudopilin PulG
MVVVLIIGILIAIALPVFAGARRLASDRAAQEDLRTGLVAAMTFQAESGTYSGLNAAQADLAEPTLTWIDAAQPAIGEIDIEVANGPDLLLIGQSRSNAFFCLSQKAGSPVTDRGHGSQYADVDTAAECTNGW